MFDLTNNKCSTSFNLTSQALNKLKKKTWRDSHHRVNIRPSKNVLFEEFIDRVKEVVDSGYYFYLKRIGKFDSMPECWNNLEEPQRREVATLLGLFNDESHGDRNKEPWSITNIKKYLNLGYVKLDNLPKFCADHFETLSDDLIFVEPPHFVQPYPENNTLLNDHDGFALSPKKLVKNYQDNCTGTKTQWMLFLHITNHAATEYCVAANKKNGSFVDIEPSAGLDVEMSEFQTSVLNTTERDVVTNDMISQSQGDRDKKKEVKRMREFVTGNVRSYYRIQSY